MFPAEGSYIAVILADPWQSDGRAAAPLAGRPVDHVASGVSVLVIWGTCNCMLLYVGMKTYWFIGTTAGFLL